MLGVRDVEKAVDYYVEELGFERPRQIFGSKTEKVYAIVGRDGVEIHLQIRRSSTTDERGHRRSENGTCLRPAASAC